MKIGIVSDSHDAMPALQAAVQRLQSEDVEVILHGGDIIAPFLLPVLAQAQCRVEAVFGNNDGEKLFMMETWAKHLAVFGGKIDRGPRRLDFGGKRILLMHEPVEIDALAASGHYDLLIHGHTHDAYVRKIGNVIALNPGEVCGYLRGRRSCAVYDTQAHEARLIDF